MIFMYRYYKHVYKVYLDGFTNEDGSVNWLPGAASVEGILANTAVLRNME